MSDRDTTLEVLKQSVADFSAEREWEPFHSLKNLAMSIAIESGELMERFQWTDVVEADASMSAAKQREAVEAELADVVIYALQFANRANIDLSDAIRRKIALNAEKYPVERSKGNSRKYDSS
ncbi:MAG: hypothetical protein CBD18_00795 [Opitutales bacterium TMED158]|nr:MAG: hypothetical protein CBD18_00795 [Opitutales bacterium TMED158]